MAAKLPLKLSYNGEILRLSQTTEHTITAVVATSRRVFGLTDAVDFKFKYQDGDGDFITVANDEDLAIAKEVVQAEGKKSLLLHVFPQGNAPAAAPAVQIESPAKPAETGTSATKAKAETTTPAAASAEAGNVDPSDYLQLFLQKIADGDFEGMKELIPDLTQGFESVDSDMKSFVESQVEAAIPVFESIFPAFQDLATQVTSAMASAAESYPGAANRNFSSTEEQQHQPRGRHCPRNFNNVHFGIVCDKCEASPIRGNRYRCTSCTDYDLCQTCFDSKDGFHAKEHTFDKVERSQRRCGGGRRRFMRCHRQSGNPGQCDAELHIFADLDIEQAILDQILKETAQEHEQAKSASTEEDASKGETSVAQTEVAKEASATSTETAPIIVDSPPSSSQSSPVAASDEEWTAVTVEALQEVQQPSEEAEATTNVDIAENTEVAPPATTSEEDEKVKALREMGFIDDEKNRSLLRSLYGHLPAVINHLLSE